MHPSITIRVPAIVQGICLIRAPSLELALHVVVASAICHAMINKADRGNVNERLDTKYRYFVEVQGEHRAIEKHAKRKDFRKREIGVVKFS